MSRKRKNHQHNAGHMTKMAAGPYMVKHLFYGKVKFCNIGFYNIMENVTMMDSLENIASCDLDFG